MRLLIATASFGTGHNQVAAALAEAATTAGHTAEVIDALSVSAPVLNTLVTHGFIDLLKIAPGLYRLAYDHAEEPGQLDSVKCGVSDVLSRVIWPRLSPVLAKFQPDVVVCTHPFILGVMANLRRRHRIAMPVAGVLTDFAPHGFWLHPGVDAYYVATRAMTESIAGKGVPASQIRATGIPIRDVFAAPPDRQHAALSLGLDPDRPTVLMMGGGLGMGPMREMVAELCQSPRPLQVLVVTGQNHRLYDQLLPFAEHTNGDGLVLRIFGYVPYIAQLMAASDLLISKAGAVTASEALAVGLPALFVQPIPGHEERNQAVLVASGAARALRNGTIGETLADLLSHAEEMAAMRRAARQMGQPQAARRVIDDLIIRLGQQSGACVQ